MLFCAQKKYRLLHRAITGGNLAEVRRYADQKTVRVVDHGGRNALHRAVLFERRFIVDDLLKNYGKLLVNGADAVSIYAKLDVDLQLNNNAGRV